MFKKFISNVSNKIKEEAEKRINKNSDINDEEKRKLNSGLLTCDVCNRDYSNDFGENCPLCKAEEKERNDEAEYQKEKRYRERKQNELAKKQELENIERAKIDPKFHFEVIMTSIGSRFKPERIRDEAEFQSQLIAFLKREFPDRDVVPEVSTENGRIDIVVDNKYAFELKIPENRDTLRNLGAQIEEYSEIFPYICVVIFDNESLNISKTIHEYAAKYQDKWGIPSLIFAGTKESGFHYKKNYK
jgi:hypothetical protein